MLWTKRDSPRFKLCGCECIKSRYKLNVINFFSLISIIIIENYLSRKKCVCVDNFILWFSEFSFWYLDVWSPIFTGFDGKSNAQVPGFWFAVGIPQCSQKQMWPIYYYPTVKLPFNLFSTFLDKFIVILCSFRWADKNEKKRWIIF